MNLVEALNEYDKVKRPSWHPDCYYYQHIVGNKETIFSEEILDEENLTASFSLEDLEADDWCEWKEYKEYVSEYQIEWGTNNCECGAEAIRSQIHSDWCPKQ